MHLHNSQKKTLACSAGVSLFTLIVVPISVVGLNYRSEPVGSSGLRSSIGTFFGIIVDFCELGTLNI